MGLLKLNQYIEARGKAARRILCVYYSVNYLTIYLKFDKIATELLIFKKIRKK